MSGEHIRSDGISSEAPQFKSAGFIGFGEAAATLAQPLIGAMPVVAYVSGTTNRPPYRQSFRDAVAGRGVGLVDSLEDVVAGSDLVVSAVVVSAAEDVARMLASYLRPGQVVVDINATSPSVKKRCSLLAEAAGADFIDGNLMGPVSLHGPSVEILCSGLRAAEFVDRVNSLGFNGRYLAGGPGASALVKMIRSIITKGLEALAIEALLSAVRGAVLSEAMRAICAPMRDVDFEDFLTMCVMTDPMHAERRAFEMSMVADEVQRLGLAPTMTRAIAERLQMSADLKLKERYQKMSDVSVAQTLELYGSGGSSQISRVEGDGI